MSRLLAPSTSNTTAPIIQRIGNFVTDHVLPGAASHDTSNNKMASKAKLIAPAVSNTPPDGNTLEVVRTRDALITTLTGLTSSLDKFAKAYLDHSEAVFEAGGVMNLGPALAPLSKLIPGANLTSAPGPNSIDPVDAIAAEDIEIDADGKKKKRKRNTRPRDPNAPKRPMTAYFRFMQEQRPNLNEQLKGQPLGPDGTKNDINKMATERWKSLTDSEREKYAAAYRKDRQIYEEQMKALGLAVGKADMHEGEAEHVEDANVHVSVYRKPTPDPFEENSDVVLSEDEDEEEEEEIAPVPVVTKAKAKPSNTEVAKKTPRQTKKKTAAAAVKDAIEVATPSFSSVNQTKSASAEAPASSPARKRKAAKTETDTAPKKRGRKSAADKVAEVEADAAAASAQLEQEEDGKTAPESAKPRKDRKKKRKSEAAE